MTPPTAGQSRSWGTRRRKTVAAFVVSVLLYGSSNAVAAPEGAAARCTFAVGNLSIAVHSAPAEEGAGSELQITVADSERLVARLAAPLQGFLEQCWKSDLNGNGQFEIVIASSTATEGQRVNIYEWRLSRFEPIRIAPVDPALLPTGALAERYSVVQDVLYCRFRSGPPGQPEALGRHVTLRYALTTGKWEAVAPAQGPAP